MKSFKYFSIILIVALALLADQVEARRKVLKGRKTITRTYGNESTLPAWAWIILIALGELVLGVVIFLLLKWRIVDRIQDNKYEGEYLVQHPSLRMT